MEQTSKDDESANPFVQMLSPEPFNVLFVHIIIHVSSLPEQSWNQQQYGHKFLEHKLKGLDPKKQFSFEVVYMCGLGSDWTIHLTLLCEISGQMIDTMKKPHHMKLQVWFFTLLFSSILFLLNHRFFTYNFSFSCQPFWIIGMLGIHKSFLLWQPGCQGT